MPNKQQLHTLNKWEEFLRNNLKDIDLMYRTTPITDVEFNNVASSLFYIDKIKNLKINFDIELYEILEKVFADISL